MFKTAKLFSLLLIVLCFVNISFAQNELVIKSSKANINDILGTWEMFYQIVDPQIKTDSLYFADYQLFKFFEDGYVKNFTSTKKIEYKNDKIYLESAPKKTTFSFVAEGLLIIERSRQDFDNIAISIIAEDLEYPLRKDAPLLKKGDLILSYIIIKGQERRVYMQRYLRLLQ